MKRIALHCILKSLNCPSLSREHHLQLLLTSVSSNDFSTTVLAGLFPLCLSKIVIGLLAGCSPRIRAQ